MQLYIKQMPTDKRIVLGGDHTGWVRPDAVTLQDRTIEHKSTDIVGNKPIAPGEGYSTIAWIPEDSGSWALPLRHERITSWVHDNPLPWQKSIDTFTPGRVAQSMGGVLATIGTPANPPKPRGKSPSWKTGQPRQRRNRCPIVKKGTSRPRKQATKSA